MVENGNGREGGGEARENRSKIRSTKEPASVVGVTFGGLVNCPIGSLWLVARSLASESPPEFVDSRFQHAAWPWPRQTTHEVTNAEATRRHPRRHRHRRRSLYQPFSSFKANYWCFRNQSSLTHYYPISPFIINYFLVHWLHSIVWWHSQHCQRTLSFCVMRFLGQLSASKY